MKTLLLVITNFIFVISFAQVPINEWTNSFGGSDMDEVNSTTVDDSGNVYTTGIFRGTSDFNPGAPIYNLTSHGDFDMFVQKVDPNGNFLWAYNFGGNLVDRGQDITIGNNNDLYITGEFVGTVDFDPSLNSHFENSTYSSAYILKLTSGGAFSWVKVIGGPNSSAVINATKVDKTGNLYFTGSYSGSPDFDPGIGDSIITQVGTADVFALKLNSQGDFIWARSFGGASAEEGYSLAIDNSNNVFITGYYMGTADFDPGIGVVNFSANGINDLGIFVVKLNSSGYFEWGNSYSGVANDVGYSICTSGENGIYITGYFGSTIDFDAGLGTFNLVSNGYGDIFVLKLDNSTGNFIWAKSIGGANGSGDVGKSVTSDATGNVYITGNYGGNVDFDPNTGVFNLASIGFSDVFFMKLNTLGELQWAKSLGGTLDDYSNVILKNGNAIYLGGYYAGTANFDLSLGTTNYTSAGNRDAFLAKYTVCSISQSTIIETACSSYISPSGNNTWTSSGIYIDTLQNANSCGADSIINIDLTIIDLKNSTTQLDGITISSDDTNAVYQWIHCGLGNIVGEISQQFTAVSNGVYAVIVSESGCVDTSVCITINQVGFEKIDINPYLNIIPNPSSEEITIEGFEKLIKVDKIQIHSIDGALIYQVAVQNGKLDVSEFKDGIYFITIFHKFGVCNLKLIKI